MKKTIEKTVSCGNCGEATELLVETNTFRCDEKMFYIQCENCGACGQLGDTEDDAWYIFSERSLIPTTKQQQWRLLDGDEALV